MNKSPFTQTMKIPRINPPQVVRPRLELLMQPAETFEEALEDVAYYTELIRQLKQQH